MANLDDALILPAPAAAPLPDVAVDADALTRDRIREMFAYNATALAGHLIGAIVVVWVYADVAPRPLRIAWGSAFALLWLLRALLAWRIARSDPKSMAALLAQHRLWIAGTLLSAALWGWAAWSFYPFGAALHQVVLILVAYTFCVACIPVLAPQFSLYLGFVGLIYVPAVARVAIHGGALGAQSAVVMVLAMAMTLVLGRNYRTAFERISALQRRTEALMEQLRAEKAVADTARQQAEIANRAKTQFFAAASHDLRQPLHAMGLFAEALRQRVHDAEVAQLVNSINESVDALEGLFSELLDITRIDSGGVEVDAQHMRIGDLWRKLRLHFEPSAFEKGLALRFRGAGGAVFADPLLVERILRNLVSNAIRYTEDGSVLVSCRKRGDRMLVQVWDTGAGIGEAEQAQVFDEFYQVPDRPKVDPDQRKGLGLGLAIVKRLADLMHAPLTLRSQRGRGTVFTLELPIGRLSREADAALPGRKAYSALTLDGRLIVVVEDEPAVRAGLEVLLKGWGATVEAFDSVAAVRDWARSADPARIRPDLLIVDYRLEDGLDGVDAIRSLRARFGAATPAVVVTGSVMTGHDRQAHEDDFHLLVKPVLPNKLRAMIAFKLAIRAPA